MPINSFRDLAVWKLGNRIAVDVYTISTSYPRSQLFSLVSQIQRAAVSIPSNIAEGFNRHTPREFERFLKISLGSCAELETQLEISFELGYISIDQKNSLIEKINHESRMLNRLVQVQSNSTHPVR